MAACRARLTPATRQEQMFRIGTQLAQALANDTLDR